MQTACEFDDQHFGDGFFHLAMLSIQVHAVKGFILATGDHGDPDHQEARFTLENESDWVLGNVHSTKCPHSHLQHDVLSRQGK